MAVLDVSCISSWHAHVYFDSASRDAAANLRAAARPIPPDAPVMTTTSLRLAMTLLCDIEPSIGHSDPNGIQNLTSIFAL